MMEYVEVFRCPLYDICMSEENREVVWLNNEPYEFYIEVKCRAPFLFNRERGQTICRLVMEADKIENWSKAINDIGRRKCEKK